MGQVVAGIASGSTALLSDAAHNFSDANALLIAYVARRVSRRNADRNFTFGYRRAELVGAIVNLTALGLIGLYLVYEGLHRFVFPVEVLGWLMALGAGLALVVDVATALLLWASRRGTLNLRTAFVHNLVDALGSVAVLIGAAAITWGGWTWVDPALTLLIAGYVIWQVVLMLPEAARILMQGTPPGLEPEEIAADLLELDGVEGVHHLHVWQLDEQHLSFEAHIEIERARADELEAIKRRIKTILADKYHIAHSTLEFEFDAANGGCAVPAPLIAEH